MEITLEQFEISTGATRENAEKYYDHALAAMDRFQISEDAERICAYLATLSIESARLTTMEESLYYRDPFRLAKIFPSKFKTSAEAVPFCRNPQALSMKLYNGFHGRGGIQLTWEKNYAFHGEKLGFNYRDNPDWLLTPDHAMLVSASYWDSARCNDVAYDMDEVTLRVNGRARMHLAERIAQRDIARGAYA
jgi:putative chitinase